MFCSVGWRLRLRLSLRKRQWVNRQEIRSYYLIAFGQIHPDEGLKWRKVVLVWLVGICENGVELLDTELGSSKRHGSFGPLRIQTTDDRDGSPRHHSGHDRNQAVVSFQNLGGCIPLRPIGT